jgi:shikimate dehydrogenase
MILTGKARVAGVIGWPVGHSRSPRLHGYWLDYHGIDGTYIPFAVKPGEFAAAVAGLAAAGLRGVNVTLPHKSAALAACDAVDENARRIGAVNTIIFKDDGTMRGSNTDAFGFLENIRQNAAWRVGGSAVVLGAGGAARAVCVALADAGMDEIHIVNRTGARAERLVTDLGSPFQMLAWEARHDALAGAALLVNTTLLGMTGQPPLDLDLSALPEDAVVNDIVYAPLETDLLARARARGNKVVDGLGMLLHQARPGFEAWFGVAPAVTGELREFVLSDP